MNHHQIIIHLLAEDLKSNKFLSALEGVGFDSSICRLDLADLVFKITGLDDSNNSLLDWYVATCNKYLEKLDLYDSCEAYLEQAFNFYVDLLVETRQMAISGSQTTILNEHSI